MKLLYEGKTKKVFFEKATGKYFLQFKNDITAFNMKKHEIMKDKGMINCKINSIVFEYLKANGIPVAYKKKISDDTIEVADVKMTPIEVVVRNRAYGSFLKRFNFKSGEIFKKPLVEFFYKDDEKNDPQLTVELCELLNIATEKELKKMKDISLKINDLMLKFYKKANIILVDFKVEFGRKNNFQLVLADELTPDSCRLWDKKGEMLDKERFRAGLGNVMESYLEILKRIEKK